MINSQKKIYTEEEFFWDIKNLSAQIEIDFDLFIGIIRGGVVPAVYLCQILKKRNLDFLRIQVYDDVKDTILEKPIIRGDHIDFDYIKGKKVLIVDELIETGTTFCMAREYLLQFKPALLKTACVYVKDGLSSFKPDYCAKVTPKDEWLVLPWENVNRTK